MGIYMNILVTGAAGFIGSHLVDRLVSDGHKVVALDKFISGIGQHLIGKKATRKLQIGQVDIADQKQVRQSYFKNIDWVFHLAGLSNIVPSIEAPIDYHQVNVSGTVYVLEAARKAKVKRFIYAASASCYGIPDVYPTPETAPIKLEYPYALTKYLGEVYTLHWGQVYKLPVISLRLFNVYGPRVRTYGTYGPVISIFMAQKLAGKPYTVVGDGRQTRDFTYISDVVDAFITAAASKVVNDVFNVGSGKPHSVNDMVKLLGGKVVHIPKRPKESNCTWADITKIRNILGWKPKVTFEEGVRKVLQDIDYWKDAPIWTPAKIKQATKEWFRYLG